MLSAQVNDTTNGSAILYVALELSGKCWKIGIKDVRHEKPSIYNAVAEQADRRLGETVEKIEAQKRKWELGEDCKVYVVYEAGQDGFWICRALRAQGYECLVADPASIPVNRQARRAKTDRLDTLLLLSSLMAYVGGDRSRMRAIRVPSEADEDMRHIARSRGELQKEIGQHRQRMSKLLKTVGNWDDVDGKLNERLKEGQVFGFGGVPIKEELRRQLLDECERLSLAEKQFAALEKEMLARLPQEVQDRVAKLERLKGVGRVGAMRLVLELFWRKFNNRRELGACVGLVPQPWDSGEMRSDQGISKQGNRRVRALLIELAWLWLRYQPTSRLARWFNEHTSGSGQGKRSKRIAIVAVARKLVIELWRYLEDGVMPADAALKRV
jgi:transposase